MIPVRWADVNNGACCGVSMAEKDWKQGKGQEGRKTYIEWAGTEKGGISALPCPPSPVDSRKSHNLMLPSLTAQAVLTPVPHVGLTP